MNYWPADTTNLAECYLPVFDMINDLTVTGARTAQVQYGAGGWVTHHNTDAWRGSSVVDVALWGMWQTGGAWLATMIWDHYQFTGDIEFLRANYPAMKGAAQFFLDTLVSHPTLGYLVTNPSNSPSCVITRTPACAPGRQWTTRSCVTCSMASPGPPKSSAWMPPSASRYWPPGTGCPDAGRVPRQHTGVARRLGGDRARLTGTSPTCTGCTPATRSPTRHTTTAPGRTTDPGTARRRRHRLVTRLEDQLLGSTGRRRPRPQAPRRPRTHRPARTEHVRPAPAVPDRRQLRRHLRHRRNAAAEPHRRTARPARTTTGLADRAGHRAPGPRRIHSRRHLEQQPDRARRHSRPRRTHPRSQPDLRRHLRTESTRRAAAPSSRRGSTPISSSSPARPATPTARQVPTRGRSSLVRTTGSWPSTAARPPISTVRPPPLARRCSSGRAPADRTSSSSSCRRTGATSGSGRGTAACSCRSPATAPAPTSPSNPRHQRRQPAVAGRRPGRRGGQTHQPAKRSGNGRLAGFDRRRCPHLPVDTRHRCQPAIQTSTNLRGSETYGPVNFDNPRQVVLLTLLGVHSRREVSRARHRTTAAMRAQAELQGRHPGGRPPYGYRLADAGPNSNRAHAGTSHGSQRSTTPSLGNRRPCTPSWTAGGHPSSTAIGTSRRSPDPHSMGATAPRLPLPGTGPVGEVLDADKSSPPAGRYLRALHGTRRPRSRRACTQLHT